MRLSIHIYTYIYTVPVRPCCSRRDGDGTSAAGDGAVAGGDGAVAARSGTGRGSRFSATRYIESNALVFLLLSIYHFQCMYVYVCIRVI